MHCPFCQTADTRVIDSRLAADGAQIRRRRECFHCCARFNTSEQIEFSFPQVIKNDGTRCAFDGAKLRQGMQKALEKRPVDIEVFDHAVTRIIQRLHAHQARDISTQQLGEWVMEALKALDHVAYVRFASVYRRFEDVQAFQTEIQRLASSEKKNIEGER